MYDLITPFLPTDHRYTLRSSGNNYCLPLCRTTSYYNSFIPSTIKLWNDLHNDIKYSPTLSIFKAKLKRMNIVKVKKHYNFGNRRENIILCQLRNKASNLNSHLMKDHITYDSHCFYCGHDCEDNFHFFIECPKYTQQRNILLQQFRAIDVPFQIDYILYGSSEYTYNLNCKIISYVHI